MWLGVVLILTALVLGGAVACGGDDDQSSDAGDPKTYVGQVEGTGAYVGILVRDDRVLAYVCDGDQTALWFHGDAKDGTSFALKNDQGATLRGQFSGGSFSGSLETSGGGTTDFETSLATGDGGLYREKATIDVAEWSSGWVVLGDGSFRGARRSTTGSVVGLTKLGGTMWTDPDIDP